MTQNSQRNATTRLNYVVDQSSLKAAIDANKALIANVQAAQQQGAATQKATIAATTALNAQISTLDKLSAAFKDVGKQNALDKLARDAARGTITINALATELQTLGATEAQINAVANSVARLQANAGSGGTSAIGGLARGLIALPNVGFQNPAVVGLRLIDAAAQRSGASLLQVGTTLAAVAPFAVGAAIAIDQFSQSIQGVKRHLSAALEAQEQYYDAVRDLTTEQAKERINEIPREAAVLQQQARETREAANRAFVLEQTLPGGDAIARLLNQFGVTSSAELEARADELEQALDALNQTFTRLKQGVQSNAFVYNDLIDAEEKLKTAREDQSNAINDGLKEIAAAAQDVEEAKARVAEIRQQLTDAAADRLDKLAQLESDTAERIADAQADAEERRREIAAEGAERRAEIEQDNADRRAEILRRFNTDYNNAVASRDALAAYKAKQTRDEELDKQEKAYKKQLDQLQKQLDKQYAAVDKALDKQLRNIQRQHDRQQASIDAAYDKQYRNLTRALNEALAAEQYANNRLEALRSDNAFRAQYWAGVVETADKRMADAAAALAVSLNQSAALIEGNSRPNNPKANGSGSTSSKDFPPLSDSRGNILSTQSLIGMPNASGLTQSGSASRLRSLPSNITRLPAAAGASSRSVTVTFAPVLNGSKITPRQFERLADDWFYRTRRLVNQ